MNEIYKVCPNCNKEFVVSRKNKTQTFCSSSCSASYNNKKRHVSDKTKLKISNSLKIFNERDGICVHGDIERRRWRNRICHVCGCDRMYDSTQEHDICKKGIRFLTENLSCFGFDVKSIGTKSVIDSYNTVVELLKTEYEVNKLSVAQIKDKYGYEGSVERLVHILRNMGVSYRTNEEKTRNAIEKGRLILQPIPSFNNGDYTTSFGTIIHYKSSYELECCEYLDNDKKIYEYESLHIKYFDTILLKYRIAIPDFYIPSENIIIEVKSRVTFDKQNMVDKFLEYKKLGYIPILRYEKENYTLEEILDIQEHSFVLNRNTGR